MREGAGELHEREMEANVHPLHEECDILATVAEVQAIMFSATWKIRN